jgi:hypothetical protein
VAFGATLHVQGCGSGSSSSSGQAKVTSELVSDGANACAIQGEIDAGDYCYPEVHFHFMLSDGSEIETDVFLQGSFRAPICEGGGGYVAGVLGSCPPNQPSVACSEIELYETTTDTTCQYG